MLLLITVLQVILIIVIIIQVALLIIIIQAALLIIMIQAALLIIMIQAVQQLQTLMKRTENVNDLMDFGMENLYMAIVIDEKYHYDGNVMLDIMQNQKMIKLE